jgi:hypothetical protein
MTSLPRGVQCVIRRPLTHAESWRSPLTVLERSGSLAHHLRFDLRLARIAERKSDS